LSHPKFKSYDTQLPTEVVPVADLHHTQAPDFFVVWGSAILEGKGVKIFTKKKNQHDVICKPFAKVPKFRMKRLRDLTTKLLRAELFH
jgi:hypothetical protein